MSQPRPFDLDRLYDLFELDGVTWRHDVDQSLAAAVRMAEHEHDVEIAATYYLMPRSPYYNLFSKTGRATVERIQELGHKIGVHCDLGAPRDKNIGALEAAEQLAHDYMLLRAGGFYRFTRHVSFHCPAASLLWIELPGYYSAYAPKWKDRYFSDSRGVFAHGDPEDRFQTAGLDRSVFADIQVNLHAEHWFPEHAGFYR